jgi:hypothetical protein
MYQRKCGETGFDDILIEDVALACHKLKCKVIYFKPLASTLLGLLFISLTAVSAPYYNI